jgi:hypothetical protein
MWDSRRLTNLWASTACNRDTFSLPYIQIDSSLALFMTRFKYVVKETNEKHIPNRYSPSKTSLNILHIECGITWFVMTRWIAACEGIRYFLHLMSFLMFHIQSNFPVFSNNKRVQNSVSFLWSYVKFRRLQLIVPCMCNIERNKAYISEKEWIKYHNRPYH